MSRICLLLVILVASQALPAAAQSPAWPTRPVRIVVPFPPGGTGDLLGRLAAKELQDALRQPVVVENRGGAGGTIGADVVAKAAPDGYSLVVSNVATHAVAPAMGVPMTYDPLKDFTHLALIAAVPSGIVVAATSPIKSLGALLDKARAAPGSVRFGSNGTGSSSHVKLVLLNRAAKVDITHVPYKGSSAATSDLFGGHIDGMIASVPDVGRNERMRLLAITTETRAARWPDVPSVKELGFPSLVDTGWFGLSGPAGLPAAIADRVNGALVAALNRADVVERLRELGAEPNRLDRAGYAAMVAAEHARWIDVVRVTNIRSER